jgi:hypothetical protein
MIAALHRTPSHCTVRVDSSSAGTLEYRTNSISRSKGGAGQLVSRLKLSGGAAMQLATAPQAAAISHLIADERFHQKLM